MPVGAVETFQPVDRNCRSTVIYTVDEVFGEDLIYYKIDRCHALRSTFYFLQSELEKSPKVSHDRMMVSR